MSQTQTFIGTLVVEYCYKCGMPFGMTRDYNDQKRRDRTSFHCPNGHAQVYAGKTEEQKLREQLADKQGTIDWYANRNTELHDKITNLKYTNRALKAAKTKIMNRVKNGVCPCCNRTFKDLQSHFKSVHPDLVQEVVVDPIHKKINSKVPLKTE